MKVTLKKGYALSGAVLAAMQKVELEVLLSPFADTPNEEQFNAQVIEKGLQIQGLLLLGGVYTTLRRIVNDANQPVVSALLCEKAGINETLKRLPENPKAATTLASIEKALETTRAASAAGGYGRTSAVTYQIRVDGLDETRKTLKKRLIAIDDELAHVNYKTEIVLPEDVVATLRSFDLV